MSHVLSAKGYVLFSTKKTNIFYGAKLIFRSFATFFGLTIFLSGVKQKFLFTDFRPVWNGDKKYPCQVGIGVSF
jgi:hypothetical protein